MFSGTHILIKIIIWVMRSYWVRIFYYLETLFIVDKYSNTRDGGTNFILRIKEQETRLTLHEHDDDDEIF
jgi:hypothetical protein